MKRLPKLSVVVLVSALVISAALLFINLYCPREGIAFSQERRELHRNKNRTALPAPADFDDQVTLASLLQPGQDQMRWSTSRAARVEGYVVSVASGPLELVNCLAPCKRDIHIHIALRPDAPPHEVFVLETTPRIEDWAQSQGWDWSEARLKKDLVGHYCRFEGWLFFDSHHVAEAENTAPGRQGNWRATAWEIHPVTKFEIIR